jgi:alginate O-acetyltransferase complex protein AlgI
VIALVGYSFLHKSPNRAMRTGYLLVLSLFFYYKSSGLFFFILVLSTITDFYIGKWIFKAKSDSAKKALIGLSLFVNLGLLVYFKYSYFFIDSLNNFLGTNFDVINFLALWANDATGTHFRVDQILLPVGISFYTFQTLSYSIDIYRGQLKPVNNIIDFGFFVSFFPQLVAGPIVRASEFIPQMFKEYKLTKADFGLAIFMIMNGLVKKIYIGDYIAVNFIDRIFGSPLHYTGFENLMALFGYSLQVYVDFSGYTDIAIGTALLLGYRLSKNFDSPYKAKNVSDFWKRWHISLSSWLKDYLYIPMGGNRKGSTFSYLSLTVILLFIVLIAGNIWLAAVFASLSLVSFLVARRFPSIKKGINTNINLILTMLIGGLWHGASWNFVIWGGLNGLGLIVYKFWRKISPWESSNNMLAVVWKIFLTFTFITFTRVFFRADSIQIVDEMLHQIFTKMDLALIPQVLLGYKWVFIVMLIGFVFHWLPYKTKDLYRNWFINQHFIIQSFVFALVVFIVYQSVSAGMQPFIYFQF